MTSALSYVPDVCVFTDIKSVDNDDALAVRILLYFHVKGLIRLRFLAGTGWYAEDRTRVLGIMVEECGLSRKDIPVLVGEDHPLRPRRRTPGPLPTPHHRRRRTNPA